MSKTNTSDKPSPKSIIRSYITITLLSTFASSFIFGVNTLFLLDAGLSAGEAFLANAFFTAGMVIFEIPTGVVADTWGRRASFLLGTVTLLLSTLFYLSLWQAEAGLGLWLFASAFIGLGFTFFSGATEAWLVDALKFSGYKDDLEKVFARGQISAGVAMLTGSVAGGVIAQFTNLGAPYIMRVLMLGVTLFVAWRVMHDYGFTPHKSKHPITEMKKIMSASVEHGIKNPPVRWVMLAAPFSAGVGVFAFYALQPYLLELWGDPEAYTIAGLAAAIIAGAQIAGGMLVGQIRKLFKRRTTVLALAASIAAIVLLLIGITDNFYVAVALLIVWAMGFAASGPVRQSYLNELIPSEQRATVLSFAALMGSAGGVVTQPALGRVADVYSYSTAYIATAAVQICALPFIGLARATNTAADKIKK